MERYYTRHSLRKNTTPGNRASRRIKCGRYGGLGLSSTGRFEGTGPNTAASRGSKGSGIRHRQDEGFLDSSQGRIGPVL